MNPLEGKASTVISNIIKTEDIAGLSNTDRATLCTFVAFQFVRTPEYRDWKHGMEQSLLDALVKQMEITDWHFEVPENYVRSMHLESMPDYVDMAVPYLLRMRVCLLKNDTDIPLWTSDNPVVCHNDLTGKIGLSSPGVQFYLPLTPRLLLWFYDGMYIDLLDDVAAHAGVSEEHRIRIRNNIPEMDSMEKANVIHANQLQTMFSTRFIFSNNSRFHMMKAFLEANEGYKKRHIFHSPGEPSTISRVDLLSHNLQHALWRYQAAMRDTDMRRHL